MDNETSWEDSCIVYQRENKPNFSLMEGMTVGQGTQDDWIALSDLHYKAVNLPAGPRYWNCLTADGELVGVIVSNAVGLLLAPRHEMFPKLKPGRETNFSNTARANYLNKHFRRASRIVTDTLYRGVGVSYRMVNLAMRLEGKRYMEIQSSMSKFNPFDLKAGFRHGNLRKPVNYERGFRWFREHFESHPADHEMIMRELNDMPPKLKEVMIKEMQDFYYRCSTKEKTGKNTTKGMSRIESLPISEVLKEIQQLAFATPVYGIWENPDLGRELPERLPLWAFDLQKPDEKLRLDLLDARLNKKTTADNANPDRVLQERGLPV